MKLIIAGGRNLIFDYEAIADQVQELGLEVDEVVSGAATGIDESGERYAKEFDLTLTQFFPDWDEYGKAAGPIRNEQMGLYADALLLIWDGKSRGSASMKKIMQKLDKPIYEIIVE